jgi:hypothetical protein
LQFGGSSYNSQKIFQHIISTIKNLTKKCLYLIIMLHTPFYHSITVAELSYAFGLDNSCEHGINRLQSGESYIP